MDTSNRRAIGRFCLCLFLALAPGCQVGRTWFHMDSNSPMPFFGFDLLQRRASLKDERLDSFTRLAVDRSASSPTVQPAASRH